MDDELLVKNETEYTYDKYLELNRFNTFKVKKTAMVILIVSISIIFLCGVLMIILGEYSDAVIYIALAIAFTVFFIFLPTLQTRKIFKSDKMLQQKIKNNFEFYNDRIEASNTKGNSKLKYEDLYRVYETDKAFYMYLNRIQVFMLSKDSFIIGDAEKLANLLQEKLGKNYKKV